jgi:amino acid transporter
MADEPQPSERSTRADERGVSIVELFEYVKNYARQETLGPLKGAWRWLALGTAAAVVLGLGLMLVMLGLLRLLQTEWERSATGRLSWLSYLIVLVVVVGLLVITISRISKKSLNKESY